MKCALPADAARGAPMPARERWAATCMSVLVVATGARPVFASDALLAVAALALAGFVAAAWPKVAVQARVFVGLALLCCAAAFMATDAGPAVVASGFAQSTQFATLLAALATLRLPMRRSRLIARAAAWLVACSARRRYAALSFGSHLLSLIFSFGVVPMMGEMLRRSGLDPRSDFAARQMLMAVIRGLALTTAWSPMAISFAIVSAALPNLQPLAFMGVGLLAAALLLAGGCALHRPVTASSSPAAQSQAIVAAGDGRALLVILAMAATLFGTTLLVYRLAGLPFIMASAITLPCFSFAWLALERSHIPALDAAPGGLAAQFFRVLTEMRSETFIFSASSFIGQAIVAIVLAHSALLASVVPAGMQWSTLAFALLCLWLIPAVAMLSIAPTIVVLLMAQTVGHSGVGAQTPLTFACALTLGWSLAIGISPVSATLLIAGSSAGVSPREIALRWNLRYTLVAGAAAGCFIAAIYALRW